MTSPTLSPTLDAKFATKPPPLLFHYTSSAGLIGILRSRELWASNVAYVNDIKEVEHAVEYARLAIENAIRVGRISTTDTTVTGADRAVLTDMHTYVGTAAKRYYIFSLSEARDVLSQWRGYCPAGDSYSLGFPSKQLSLMATAQGFTLAPCIYDEQSQHFVVGEILTAFLSKYRASRAIGADDAELRKQISWGFGQHVARIGAALKHRTYDEEKEWRLISPGIPESHPQVDHRPSPKGVVPYFRFQLTDEQHPNLAQIGDDKLTVFVGPNSDRAAAQHAVHSLCRSLLGQDCPVGGSEIPYRT